MRPARRAHGIACSTSFAGRDSRRHRPAMTVRVAIAGAGGRMGQALIEATFGADDLTLAGALDVAGSPAIGGDAGDRFGARTGVRVTSDVDAVVDACDVLVDFTRP